VADALFHVRDAPTGNVRLNGIAPKRHESGIHVVCEGFLANRVMLEALSGIARRRQDARDGTRWDRRRPLLEARPG